MGSVLTPSQCLGLVPPSLEVEGNLLGFALRVELSQGSSLGALAVGH